MATTIDELVVRIKADTKQLNKSLDDIKKKTKDVGQSGKKGLAPSTNALLNMRLAANAAGTAILGMRTAMLAVGAIAGTVFLLMVKKIADVGMAFEDLQISLNTVFGGIKQGDKAFEQVISFAKTTPFQIEDVTKAFIRLKSAGLEPNIEMLKTFGDAASIAGNATEAFAALVKIASKATGGGLGLEELEQLETQGIAVYPILRKELGLTRDKIADFGKSTAGAALIIKALQKGLKETTGGTMAARMGNLSTKVSNLTIAFKELALTIFNGGLGDELKDMADEMTRLIDSLTRAIAIRDKLSKGQALTVSENVTQINSTIGTNVIGNEGMKNKLLSNVEQVITLVPDLDLDALSEAQQRLRLGILKSQADIRQADDRGNTNQARNLREVLASQLRVNGVIDKRILALNKIAGTDTELASKKTIASLELLGKAMSFSADLDKLRENTKDALDPFREVDAMMVKIGLASLIMKDRLNDAGEKIGEEREFNVDDIKDMTKFVGEMRDEIQATIDDDNLTKLQEQFASTHTAIASVADPLVAMRDTLARMRAEFDSEIPWVRAAAFGTMTDDEILESLRKYKESIAEIENPAKDLAKTLGDTLAQAITNLAHQFTNNFVNALLEGKNALSSFKDFAKSMVSQIISIFLQMEVVNRILNAVFSGANGGKGLDLPTDSGLFASDASGGHYNKGTPTLVGERGPELIIPNTSGSVMNGMNTKNAMGGGSTIVVNQSLNFSTGVVGTVRAEIHKMMPTIAEVSKSAVLDASRRGGNYRKGLLGA
jgi:hypothetical protein